MSNVVDLFRADARRERGVVPKVAKATGINPKTLYNILYHPNRDPRGSITDKLRAYYTAPRRRSTDQPEAA